MIQIRLLRVLRHTWPMLLTVVFLGGYWLFPITGRVTVWSAGSAEMTWPQIEVRGGRLEPGQEAVAVVQDIVPWTDVRLTVNSRSALLQKTSSLQGDIWRWEWSFAMPKGGVKSLAFYHDCDDGCIERGRVSLTRQSVDERSALTPIKLGVVFPDTTRSWHHRSGWAVDLTYVRPAMPYWGPDELAQRVAVSDEQGLRVLVRVDLAPGQSLPPEGDQLTLAEYLAYLRRLARDDRLGNVYGYIIGSGYNAAGANGGQRPISPGWYARVFNGAGRPVAHPDNAAQTMRLANPQIRVLVGPLQPWARDAAGDGTWAPAAPWLDYMHAMVAAINASATEKAAAGISLATPDGFALQAPGRPGARVGPKRI